MSDIAPSARGRRAFLVSAWTTGATDGRRLGDAGYSYAFLAELYLPLLAELGEVVRVGREPAELAAAAAAVRGRGLEPVHVSFAPFQNATFAPGVPNTVVLAWEFPDIPDHPFDDNPQNDWVATSERCDLVIVASRFNRDVLERHRVRCPVRVVPAPVPVEYYALLPWAPGQRVWLDCRAHVFTGVVPEPKPTDSYRWASRGVTCLRRAAKALTPPIVKAGLRRVRPADDVPLGDVEGVELSGVVYTCVINPDGRKNWDDTLTAFVFALRDRPDATLVIKLASSSPARVLPLLERCGNLGIEYRCRVVVVTQFLTHGQMLDLARATTFYATTTRAEGICLPLMNYLAAGRPAVAAMHTGLTDYFGPDVGFVIDSHDEPAAFPHDSRWRQLTRWRRIVWTSAEEQFRRSYETAQRPAEYAELAGRAQDRLKRWAGEMAVRPKLFAALEVLGGQPGKRAA